MKKNLIIAAAVVALPFATMAQSGFKLGAKVGLNMSNIVGTDIFETSSKMGLHIGPMAHYGFGDEGNFSVLAELLFDMKGYKSGTDEIPVALNYIDIPIMARYRFGFGMYLETGIYFGILMSASVDGESDIDNGDGTTTAFKDYINGSDLGYCVGIGYIHQSGFGIGYRYNLGLSDINKAADDDDFDTSANLNTVGQISLMYYFNWED